MRINYDGSLFAGHSKSQQQLQGPTQNFGFPLTATGKVFEMTSADNRKFLLELIILGNVHLRT